MTWVIIIAVILFFGSIIDSNKTRRSQREKEQAELGLSQLERELVQPPPEEQQERIRKFDLELMKQKQEKRKKLEEEIKKHKALMFQPKSNAEPLDPVKLPPVNLPFPEPDNQLTPEQIAIKTIIDNRQIKYLVHFTNVENLRSIMQKGLVTRYNLEMNGHDFHYNDSLRLDSVANSISLSVTFPNWKMLYKYRQECPQKDWIILLLDPTVLLEKNCFFCKHNAADKRISRINRELLKGARAFEGMFEGDVNEPYSLPVSPNFTFDPQAEVLVLENINLKYIKHVIFNNPHLKQNLEVHLPFYIRSQFNPTYFKNRDYVSAYNLLN